MLEGASLADKIGMAFGLVCYFGSVALVAWLGLTEERGE